jgi:hypothetical protein
MTLLALHRESHGGGASHDTTTKTSTGLHYGKRQKDQKGKQQCRSANYEQAVRPKPQTQLEAHLVATAALATDSANESATSNASNQCREGECNHVARGCNAELKLGQHSSANSSST